MMRSSKEAESAKPPDQMWYLGFKSNSGSNLWGKYDKDSNCDQMSLTLSFVAKVNLGIVMPWMETFGGGSGVGNWVVHCS